MYTGKNNKKLSRQRGMTLMEILISFTVLFIGMLTLFKVATVATRTNLTSRNIHSGITKAQDHLEALKDVPVQTLACLASGSAPAACLSSCVSNGADVNHCNMALGMDAAHNSDGHGVTYTPSFGVRPGPWPDTYEIEILSQWQGEETPPRTHKIYFKTVVYKQ
ncbi:prepilin-type N-terminal cleavage/methylation domain-containing protein [Myxococcota bacterium]|nr:prepilin-type N-terminal cleavage/methylation domain-containing protein [Myxococcota bacterium]MBU1380791.1 prepilin-type N-terminal cleavage/methylation domain-containing protein [Myxococcota bacterium]MBU1498925.1 prepilin-type N-terminal cleavage/methylation domain-containing protein [Myxococcota bacterium]